MTRRVFPFRHNWREGLRETLAWKTDVFTARDDSEQRRSIRSTPRRELEYSILIPNDEYRRAFHALMTVQHGDTFFVPVWSDWQYIGAVSSGATSVSGIEIDGFDFDVAGYALLWESPFRWSLLDNLSISGDTVGWTTATDRDYVQSRIVPVRRALLEREATSPVHSLSMEEWRVTFRVEADEVSRKRVNETTPSQWDSVDIFETPSNEDNRQVSFARAVEPIDFETGIFIDDRHGLASRLSYDFQWLLGSRAEIAALLGWFRRRRGKAVPFWWETFARDVVIAADITGTDTTIDVTVPESFAYSTLWGATPPATRQAIAIRLKTGTVLYRRITAIASVDTTTDRFTLNTSFPYDIAVSEIERTGWLLHTRLESDSVELRWESDSIVRVGQKFRELIGLPVVFTPGGGEED